MAYSKQTWDTTSYVNPTRMNHIEDGIEGVSNAIDNLDATDVAYDSNTSVKEMLTPTAYTSYTINDTNVKHSSASETSIDIIQMGKLVFCSIRVMTTKIQLEQAPVLLSNIPIPKVDTTVFLQGTNNEDYRLRVQSDGKLYSWYGTIPANTQMFGSFMYLTD